MPHRARSGLARALLSLAVFACALLIYYALPLRALEAASDAVGLVLFVAGVLALAWLLIRQIRSYGMAPTETGGRLLGLLSVIYLVVIVFSLSYYLIESVSPGEFAGLETRTDALYFTVVTLGTVGYGDVHAVGQVARATTMVQVMFDLVLIGLLLSIASSHIGQRLASARRAGTAQPE